MSLLPCPTADLYLWLSKRYSDRGGNADIWLIKYNQPQDKTYSELERDYAPYARFKAFQDRKVYGCNTNHVPFYEESPFHPELLLKDLIKNFPSGAAP